MGGCGTCSPLGLEMRSRLGITDLLRRGLGRKVVSPERRCTGVPCCGIGATLGLPGIEGVPGVVADCCVESLASTDLGPAIR